MNGAPGGGLYGMAPNSLTPPIRKVRVWMGHPRQEGSVGRFMGGPPARAPSMVWWG